MAATTYSVFDRYNSYATSAPYIASAFSDNASQADLLQIENQGGIVIVAVDYLGTVHFSATGLTATGGVGGTGLYTLNRQVIGKFRVGTIPSATITTVAQAFAAAFPQQSSQQQDIIQVIAPGGTIGYYINYAGVASGS
jgi:hypothetical protein